MQKLKNFFWKLFCEADEQYPDLVRIGYALTLVCALGYAGWATLINGQDFSMTDFGTGISLILFGGGAGIGIRGRLEDGPTNKKGE